ncbi:hypothetical protein IL992_08650 [Microbispora sp. NEAU-D428]|nr:hypothetical protein [Microbispora sitophila]MBE3009263.1 hypothetical protein [Microbispora sitophila]
MSGFTLLTGAAGAGWTRAARDAADRLGVPLAVCRIAPGAPSTADPIAGGTPVTDTTGPAFAPGASHVFDAFDAFHRDGRWPGLAGIAADGALLVRPDQIVAWRAPALPAGPAGDPAADLARALAHVLARS